MTRRHLNKRQLSRVSSHSASAKYIEAQIIARYGKDVELQYNQGQVILCKIPGKLQGNRPIDDLVVGDKVLYNPETNSIEGLCERETALVRYRRPTSMKSKSHTNAKEIEQARGKIVAANISQICVVIAPVPSSETIVIDEYLLAAQIQGFDAMIISNKSDLPESEHPEYTRTIAAYRNLGYQVEMVSTLTPESCSSIKAQLENHTSVLLGTSGVGKSSLLNTLAEKPLAKVGHLSNQTTLGKHTTTTARLYQLPSGGDIIDSPGIREFKLAVVDFVDLCQAYSDLYAGQTCQYSNCTHRNEPKCAVLAALEQQQALRWRYDNYLAMYNRLVEYQH